MCTKILQRIWHWTTVQTFRKSRQFIEITTYKENQNALSDHKWIKPIPLKCLGSSKSLSDASLEVFKGEGILFAFYTFGTGKVT